eukprot:125992-Amphidinium_carterae.1
MWASKPGGQFLYLKKKGTRKSLLEYSALHGFPQCTVPQLKALHDHLGLEVGEIRLKTERDLLDALLPACLPTVPAEGIEKIKETRLAKKRVTKQAQPEDSTEEVAGEEVPFQEVLEEDDVLKLKQALRNRMR